MKNENEKIIYKVENNLNGKIYIGSTRMDITSRKKDHLRKANNGNVVKFYEAIITYGDEAFKWEQIDTANSIDELAQKEKRYIIKYNSKLNGYNSDSGGGFKKTVYKYDLESRELVESFKCLDDAGESVGATRRQISRACLNVNQIYEGFYWSYDKFNVFEPRQDQRKKLVCQYTLDNIQIALFSSIAEASTATGVNKSCIAKVCRGERKTAGGYYFNYSL
jgi:group I intron endonuclease